MSIKHPEEILRLSGDKYTALSIAHWCSDNNLIRDIDYSWYLADKTVVFEFKHQSFATQVKEMWNNLT